MQVAASRSDVHLSYMAVHCFLTLALVLKYHPRLRQSYGEPEIFGCMSARGRVGGGGNEKRKKCYFSKQVCATG